METKPESVPVEVEELILSRRIVCRGIRHYQTLNGHLFDLMKALYDLLRCHEQVVYSLARNCRVSRASVHASLFFAAGLRMSGRMDAGFQKYLRDGDNNAEIDRGEAAGCSLSGAQFSGILETCTGKTPRRKEKERPECATAGREKSGPPQPESRDDLLKAFERRLKNIYHRVNLAPQFRLGDRLIEEQLRNFSSQYTPEKSGGGNNSPDTGAVKPLFEFARYCLREARTAADRALLKKIYARSWNVPSVIHGSALEGCRTRRSVVKTGYTGTPGRKAHRRKTYIIHAAGGSVGDRLRRAVDWIRETSAGSRLTIVAASEEELITMGHAFAREGVAGTFNVCDAGVFRFSGTGMVPLDTILFSPDSASEPLSLSLPAWGAVSLYTYPAVFARLSDREQDSTEFRGEFLSCPLILWGVPFGDDESFRSFRMLLDTMKGNAVHVLAVTGRHTGRYRDVLQDTPVRREKIPSDTGGAVDPLLEKSLHPFLERFSSVHPDFVLEIKAHGRKGAHQLILEPDPVSVQKLYYELMQTLAHQRHPFTSIALYHGFFELAGKTEKMRKIASALDGGPLLVVSTLGFFSHLVKYFSVIFIENIPFFDCLCTLANALQGYLPREEFPVPRIVWSAGYTFTRESLPAEEDDFSGILTEEKLRKLAAAAGGYGDAGVPERGMPAGSFPAVVHHPKEGSDLLDAARRFMFPAQHPGLLGAYAEAPDNRFIQRRRCGMLECALPYHSNLGLICPPEWRNLFLP